MSSRIVQGLALSLVLFSTTLPVTGCVPSEPTQAAAPAQVAQSEETASRTEPPPTVLPHPEDNAIPDWPTEGWRTSTPEEQGMDSAQLAAMLATIEEEQIDIDSVLVIRNGTIVAEAYVYPETPTTLHVLYSCTKSVTSALVGIAIDHGTIESVDQRVLDFFPDRAIENRDARKESMTVEHLLTMTSGLDWPGGWAETAMQDMFPRPDWVQFMLDRPMADEPGARWVYNSGSTNLLAAILAESTGMGVRDFAEQSLFGPLNITEFRWETDPQGTYLGGWGLWMTPRDMAKFGTLYLNRGRWEDQQIVPEAWVEASTTAQVIPGGEIQEEYGYLFWIDGRGYTKATGRGGQLIVVKPDLNLVVVFTSSLFDVDASPPETLMNEYVFPAALSSEPLAENPDGLAALEAAVNALSEP